MHWQRLDRDTTIEVINNVKSEANAGMFSVGTSEVQRARLPFYKKYSVYKVTNYASLPSFTFQYLSDGTFFHHLDGTETPIHTVNDKGDLNLDKNNVLEYLTFFFAHVGDEDGDVIVINNPHDMPLLDSLDADSYNAVFSQHKPPEVHYDGGFEAYEIEVNLYKDSQLVRAEIEVTERGRVKIKSQKMIMQQVLNTGAHGAIL
jgi:phage-related protein